MRVVAGISVPEPGDRVVLEHDGHADVVTVVAVLDGGRKVDVRFDSGSMLRVQSSLLGQVPVHHRHRTGDMDTAIAAAQSTADGLTHTQILVLTALAAAGTHGMLDHDHEPINGLGQDTAGKRRGELVDLHLVVDSGFRRRTPRGRNAAVWTITTAGRQVLHALQRKGAA